MLLVYDYLFYYKTQNIDQDKSCIKAQYSKYKKVMDYKTWSFSNFSHFNILFIDGIIIYHKLIKHIFYI